MSHCFSVSLGAESLLQENLPLLQFFKGCALVVRYSYSIVQLPYFPFEFGLCPLCLNIGHKQNTNKNISSAFIPHHIGGSRLGKGCEGRFHDDDDDDDGDDDNDDGDIYIMMRCLSVCHEKSSPPPWSLL